MPRFDLLIRNVLLFDGSGEPPERAVIGVAGDRITLVAPAAVETPAMGSDHHGATEVIEGHGLALAPGFIDVHTHDDRALLVTDMAAKISQGVTTVVAGNCGISLAPLSLRTTPPPPLDLLGQRGDYAYPTFAAYLDALDRQAPAVNAVALVGHSTLRVGAMDRLDRPASGSEIDAMRQRLGEALDAGAIGLSTGLDYAPARAAPTAEVIALAALLGPAGAIHTTHMRDEGDHVVEAMEEAFAIGRSAEAPVVVSHFKVHGRRNFGRSVETLARFDAARAAQPLGLDAYPYAASSTVLTVDHLDSADRVLVTWSKSVPEAAGRDLAEIAAEWGCSKEQAAERLQPAGAVYFGMDEADVRRILAYPHTMIGSDGLPHDQHPHPRLWGSFPRVLGHYAREVKLFSMAEAIRRMTSLPAGRFGLSNRGRIAAGCYADLVLFDPATVKDTASFADPKSPAAGVHGVWVNGQAVWRDGAATGARPGKALRRQALQREVKLVSL